MIFVQLFYEFFITGLFSVGGGLATLPFLYDMADRLPWFDRAMLSNMIAISESTPGPIGVNMATYAGFHTAGILGGLVATLGLILPSYIVIVLIAKFLAKFSENFYVKSAFYGLRPAVTALIAASGFQIVKITVLYADVPSLISDINWKAIIFLAILLFTVLKFKKHPIIYIAAAAVVGVVFKL